MVAGSPPAADRRTPGHTKGMNRYLLRNPFAQPIVDRSSLTPKYRPMLPNSRIILRCLKRPVARAGRKLDAKPPEIAAGDTGSVPERRFSSVSLQSVPAGVPAGVLRPIRETSSIATSEVRGGAYQRFGRYGSR